MARLGCDSIDKLKAKLPQLRAELQASRGDGWQAKLSFEELSFSCSRRMRTTLQCPLPMRAGNCSKQAPNMPTRCVGRCLPAPCNPPAAGPPCSVPCSTPIPPQTHHTHTRPLQDPAKFRQIYQFAYLFSRCARLPGMPRSCLHMEQLPWLGS